MVIDGRSLGEGDELEADVCVVGAGPAGITIARALAEGGCRVCVLESGAVEPHAETDKLSDGKSVGYWYYPLRTSRARAFGGTSQRWFETSANREEGWRARPLDATDFERRAEIPHSGWPFGYEELHPYYERAQSLCRLGPYDYSLERWETEQAQPLPLNGDIRTLLFQHGFENFGSYFDDVSASDRVQLVLRTTAIEIETDGATGGVTKLVATHEGRARIPVKARVFVLAAGGIDNARLLLVSRGSQPGGLGNGEDLVGRFFMERLTGRTGYITPAGDGLMEHMPLYRGIDRGDAFVWGVLSPSAAAIRREGLLNCGFFLVPDSRASSSDGVRAVATLVRSIRRRPLPGNLGECSWEAVRGAPDIVRARLSALRGARPEIVALRVQAEQAPNPDSRVTLGDDRDYFGLPKARLDWRLTELDSHSIRRTQELLDVELRDKGLGRLEQKLGDERPAALFLGSYHHMGTTRMHESSRQGVVDANCRVHGVENLFVAGASVFPTSGFANPTLTVVALSFRLADHIKERLAS